VLLPALVASWVWVPRFIAHPRALAASEESPPVAETAPVPADDAGVAPVPEARIPTTLNDLLPEIPRGLADGKVAAVAKGGDRRPLTLDPQLQSAAQRLLDSYQVPLGELVALDPATGRVLAYARSSAPGPTSDGLDPDSCYPAASVFKLVTAAALLEQGVPANEEVCYHGGKHRLHSKNLEDDDQRDRVCATLAEAVARSANAAMVREGLAHPDVPGRSAPSRT